jgi:diguanylate cyclase
MRPTTARRPGELSRMVGVGQLLAAAAALGVACCILLAYQFVALRRSLTDDLAVQAAIIADNVAATLMFHDQDAAHEMLRSFRHSSFLAAATVYDRQDVEFAAYRNGTVDATPPLLRDWTLFAPLSVARPIRYRGMTLGRVVLTADTGGIRNGLLRYGALLALASLGALVTTSLLTRRTKARMHRAESQLKHLAYTDTVTSLPNRRCTYESLELEIAMHTESGGRVGLLLIDLDNFKVVNDTAGHAAGDRLLRQVASVLRATARSSDRIGRIGGDEFAVIIAPLDDPAELERVGRRIVAGLRK